MSTEDVSNVKLEAKITEINETESLINEEDTKNTLPRSSSKSPSLVKKDSSSCLQKKKVKHFYERQNSLLEKYEDDSKIVNGVERNRLSGRIRPVSTSTDVDPVEELLEEESKYLQPPNSPKITVYDEDKKDIEIISKTESDRAAAKRLALLTLIINVTLMIIKAVASYMSGSLSIISSLVDSLVDITSGLVIWVTARAIKKRDPYLYPRGRTRLEPLALVIVSVVMAVASVQMLSQAIKGIIEKDIHPDVRLPSILIMITTIAVKLGLFIACRMHKEDASISVLAQDHRNDCVSNTVALLCAYGSKQFWIYLDPIGAILVSIYIALTWYQTGKEQLKILSGRSAEPEFINRIIKICIDHDTEVQFIDTVYVYHFGLHFLVEVHIVLDPEMALRKAHDISEALQIKLEALPEVERAFVHCDYEFEHQPQDEHKVV